MRIIICLTSLALAFLVGIAWSQQVAEAHAQTGRIAGTMIAEDKREPLAGATVEVLGPALKKKIGAVSRADGLYAVENIPVGTYTVKATFSGYRGETVRGVVVVAGASVEVDFRLTVAPYEMGEMVVSASRHAENIVDAPASISKVDAKEVQRNTVASSYANIIKSVKGIDYTHPSLRDSS